MVQWIENARKTGSPGRARDNESVPDELRVLYEHQPRDEEMLKSEYRAKGLDQVPDTFVLYRIIGNDLYPRHARGQSRANVRFILDNEPELEGCEKRWIVNRIVDADERHAIIDLLENFGQPYLEIPFRAEEFAEHGWDYTAMPRPGFLSSRAFFELEPLQQERVHTATYRNKNLYLMNNNGARNAALEDGLARAKWVLPWDGNCFVTRSAWRAFREAVTASAHLKYFVVPMERVTDNHALLDDAFEPCPVEEPQIAFRQDAGERFGENHPYGRRPKVELFWRLQIPGKWDRWTDDPWEQPRGDTSPDAGHFGVAGWVARLSSGRVSLEAASARSFKERGLLRQEAIRAAINHVMETQLGAPDPLGMTSFRLSDLEGAREELTKSGYEGPLGPTLRAIVEDAEAALQRPPGSVIDKTEQAPSGDPHDYFHPAPYWWPNPDSPDGLPYVQRDGERVPGTEMYDPQSDRFDRTRLQHLFDDGISLALAWLLTNEERFARHGAAWIDRWFVDQRTRMNPHLRFAQVRRGHNGDEGAGTGIIEMKDLYYYLDAVRILEQSGSVSETQSQSLREWLQAYLQWLHDSPQGIQECQARNNHGTYYDLQVAAITAFLGDTDTLFQTLIRAEDRLSVQVSDRGVQYHELTRTMTAHYTCFTLQGWLNLLNLVTRFDQTFLKRVRNPSHPLRLAVHWLLSHEGFPWPYPQLGEFDDRRLTPIAYHAHNFGLISLEHRRPNIIPTCFSPHTGVRPYWLTDSLINKFSALNHSNVNNDHPCPKPKCTNGKASQKKMPTTSSSTERRITAAEKYLEEKQYHLSKKQYLEICASLGRQTPLRVFRGLKKIAIQSPGLRGAVCEGANNSFGSDPVSLQFQRAYDAAENKNYTKAQTNFKEGLKYDVPDEQNRAVWESAFKALLSALQSKKNRTYDAPQIQPSQQHRKKIFISGMHTSGSSAVADYLSEYEDVALIPFEQRHLEVQPGLIQLRSLLHDKRRFLTTLSQFFSVTLFGYSAQIKSFSQAKATLLASDLRHRTGSIQYALGADAFLHSMTYLQFDNSESDLAIFSLASNTLLDGICSTFTPDARCYVLDNVLHTRSVSALEWLPNSINVSVVRDPRCNFVSRVRKRSLRKEDVDDYITTYKQHREFLQHAAQSVNQACGQAKCVIIRFEDFVLKPSIRQEIRLATGLQSSLHMDEGTRFIQRESALRLRRHDGFDDQQCIKRIESKLSKYTVDFHSLQGEGNE